MNTVDEWILYLKANPTEKDTIDKVHHNYNALHIAIINNSVSLLEKLVDEAKAGMYILYICISYVCCYNLILQTNINFFAIKK